MENHFPVEFQEYTDRKLVRMDQARIPKIDMIWSPPGKRIEQRPHGTELPWLSSAPAVQNRDKWKGIVYALSATREEED